MANKKETLQGWDAPPPPYTPPYAGSESLSSPKEKSGHVVSELPCLLTELLND